MAKNLRGKELGKGISQRKDGRYSARFLSLSGKRIEKYFDTPKEAKQWLEDKRYEQRHGITPQDTPKPNVLTVDEWFNEWWENIIFDLSPNTRRNYKERYEINVKPVIGTMNITDVKPMHCKKVLKQMDDKYAGSTIRQTYITMGTLFKSALMNDLISKHPMDGVQYSKPIRAVDDIKYLTVEEQRIFLETAKSSHNYNQYALILETGLRTGELIGLTWQDIDWENRTLSITKTLEYRYKQKCWRAGAPKTQTSYRTIPLTDRAYNILLGLYEKRTTRKESSLLSQVLEYIDRRSGKKAKLAMRDLVFINWRTGEPTKNSSYDTHLYKLCDTAGISRFSMHALRHTFATRAIEYGVQPKVLQKLLGHSSIKTTMDRYVHVSTDSLSNAIQIFEKASRDIA